MQQPNYQNAFAPVGFAGVVDTTPAGFLDSPFSYVYDVVLTSGQAVSNASVPIQTDSDFLLRGVYISFSTGIFGFRWSDSNNQYFSDGLVSSVNFATFAGQPFVMLPEVWYPAGSKLSLDITDFSLAPNTVEIVFIGVKRFTQGV